MALIFAYATKFIEDKTQNNALTIICIIFYAVFPLNHIFAISTAKDTLFAGFTLLFIIQLYKFIERKNEKLVSYIPVIVSGTLMLLFRNNAIYALILFIPFLILTVIKEKIILYKLIFVILMIILSYILINNFFINITNAKQDVIKEKLSIFSQATAKIAKENKEELTEEEKAKIDYYFYDYEILGNVYKTNIADNSKNTMNCENVENNKIDFIKFMIHLFKQYPKEFIISFIDTTRGYWNIFDNTFNQIGHEDNPMTMGMVELTNYQPHEDLPKIEEHSYIPKLKEFYQKMFCMNYYRKIPILFLLFQPATYFYVLIVALIYAIYKKNKKMILIETYLLLYFLTCFLGPVALIRYIYAVIVSVPIFSISIEKFKKCRRKNETEIK